MSLFLCQQPFEDLLFDDVFEDSFMNFPLEQFKLHHPRRRIRYSNRNDKVVKKKYFKENQMMLDIFDDEDKDDILIEMEPDFDFREDKSNYYIYVELPFGMTKDQIRIEADKEGLLTISGENETVYDYDNAHDDDSMHSENETFNAQDEDENDFSMVEQSYNNFFRSFNIPEDADINKIQAKVKKGILKITIKKLKSLKNRIHKIEIQR